MPRKIAIISLIVEHEHESEGCLFNEFLIETLVKDAVKERKGTTKTLSVKVVEID